jgi:hypothetical protein
MPASITDKYKRMMLDDLWRSFHNLDATSLGDSDFYHIGIGRSEEWAIDETPPTPGGDLETSSAYQSGLQAVKQVADLSYVVPRYNWSAGSIYTAWSNSNHSETTVGALQDIAGSYYVITEEQNVYVCLQQGKTDEGVVRNSIYKPDQVTAKPFEAGPDGYLWKFLYNVGVYNARRYLTSEWIPVERIEDSSLGGPGYGSLSASRLAQVINQEVATPGQIMGIKVEDGGTGYTSLNPPAVVINNPKTRNSNEEAKAYARVNTAGEVFQIILKDSQNADSYSLGANYDNRTYITFTGGTGSGVKATPEVYLDSGGMAHDPRNDLNASALMYGARIVGNEFHTFSTGNDFRQVGLIRNLTRDSVNDSAYVGNAADGDFKALRGNALRKIYVGAGIDASLAGLDNTVTGLFSGAVAFLDYYTSYIDSDCCDSALNTTHNVLYVHQNAETGFKKFQKNETVELSDAAGVATIIAHADSDMPAMRWAEVDAFSGEVLYVDNRVPIDRDEEQTEDIKIVIDL